MCALCPVLLLQWPYPIDWDEKVWRGREAGAKCVSVCVCVDETTFSVVLMMLEWEMVSWFSISTFGAEPKPILELSPNLHHRHHQQHQHYMYICICTLEFRTIFNCNYYYYYSIT